MYTTAIFTLLAISLGTYAPNANSETLQDIQHDWAHCQYEVTKDSDKEACLERTISKTQIEVNSNPDRQDLRVWLAINKSTLAGVKGGLGALDLVEESRDILEDVLKKDPSVLNGSAYTSLGSLYYKVPGWPIGFGDDDKAGKLLSQALKINPDGIDPNYFYGEYLAEEGLEKLAVRHLKKALAASPRPGREVADAGRRKEAQMLLEKLQ